MLNRDSSIPLYCQLKQHLLDAIESGRWKPGDLIPGDLELQRLYGVSRSPVRQALHELSVEGIGHPSCVFARRPSMAGYVKSRRGPAAGKNESNLHRFTPSPNR